MRALSPSPTTVRTYSLGIAAAMAMNCALLSHSYVAPASAQQTVESPTKAPSPPGKSGLLDTAPTRSTMKRPHKLIRKPAPKSGTVASSTQSTSYPNTSTTVATVTAPIGDSTAKDQTTQTTYAGTAPTSTLQMSASSLQTSSSALMGSITSAPSGNTSIGSSGLTAAASGGNTSTGSSASRQLGRLISEMPGLTQLVSPTTTITSSTTSPTIGMSPTSLSFTAQQGGGNPASQTLSISNTGGGSLVWAAGDNAAWLALNPGSGSGNGTITATVTTGALAVGTYSATISVSASGAATVSVPVTFTVTAAPVPPAIGVSPTSLSFGAQQGGSNPASQTLNISNTGGGTLAWSSSDSASWLTLAPASGTGNGTVTATVTTGTLAAGTYGGTITLNATGATTVAVPVTFTVTAASTTMTLSPSSLTFSAVQGGVNPINQSVAVTSNGSWNASSNASWLTVSPSSGSGNGILTASINLATAVVGTNNATITLTGGGVTSTTTVTLTMAAATASLVVSPSSLTYSATQGAANPANQSMTVTSNVSWTVSKNASWLTVSPSSGSNNGTITATVNTSTASIGSNTAVITVTGGGITRTVDVTLTLNAPATSSATLTWNQNTETTLASYRIYRSTTPGVYGAAIGTVPAGTGSYVAGGLQVGNTYYFTVTAVDSAGNESSRSNEVSKSIF